MNCKSKRLLLNSDKLFGCAILRVVDRMHSLSEGDQQIYRPPHRVIVGPVTRIKMAFVLRVECVLLLVSGRVWVLRVG